MSPFVCILIAILWGIYLWSRRHFYKLAWEIGGPIGFPFIGSILEFRKVADFMDNVQEKIWKKYKSPCAVWAGTGLHIILKDPETAQVILNSNDFLDKHMMYNPFKVILGENNIISSKAEIWKLHRKAADPAFNYQNVNRMIPSFNKAIDAFMSDIVSPLLGKGEVDIKESLVKLFGDLTVENTVGQSLNFLNSSHDDVTFLDHIIRLQEICVHRSIKLHLHNDFLFKLTDDYQEIKKTNITVHSVLEEFFRKHPGPIGKIRYTDGQNSLLEFLKKYEGKPTFTEKDICHDMGAIMVASYETSAFALFLILFYMAQYPKLQEKVFDELLTLYPEKNPQVALDTLGELLYTEMFINEVLRLHPPIPMIGRQAVRDTRLSTGLFIPKGTQVLVDFVHLHRNKGIWGPHADEFNPNNFLPENVNRRSKNAFMPFSLGMRNCIGMRYAKILLKIAVAKLVRSYKFKTSWTIRDVKLIPGIVTTIQNNPLIVIENRLE